MAAGTILSHFSGAAVPFWWCSQVRVAKMVFMAVVNYQTQCRRRHRRQKRILKAVMLFTAAIRRQWCNQRAKRACIAEAGWDRKLSCVAAPRGPEAMCAGRRVHRAHAAIGEGTSNVFVTRPSLRPSSSVCCTGGAPVHKSLRASIISFIPRGEAARAAAVSSKGIRL